MAGVTNKGKYTFMSEFFRTGDTLYIALVTAATAPDADTNTLDDLTEVAAGNGYSSGGTAILANSTYFPTITEDDDNDYSPATMTAVSWTATVGNIPASGEGPRHAVLLANNSGVAADRNVLAYWSLGTAQQITPTNSLTISGAIIRADEN
jgi:hypothetical protein